MYKFMAQTIHFKDLPCIKGNKKRPVKYTETFRKEKVSCEACLKEINKPLTKNEEKVV